MDEKRLVMRLQQAALRLYSTADDSTLVLRHANLAARLDNLLTGVLHPELAPVPGASSYRTGLLWALHDCRGDDHAYTWLRRTITELTNDPAYVQALVDDLPVTGDYLRQMAGFRNDPEAYRWVPLPDLPPPHNPFRCDYAPQFDGMLKKQTRHAKLSRLIGIRRTRDEVVQRAGQDFTQAILARPACSWHDDGENWPSVLPIVEHVQKQAQTNWTESAVRLLIQQAAQPLLVRAVTSMFFDPIIWSEGNAHVGNGQHRLLAMRRADVARVLVTRY